MRRVYKILVAILFLGCISAGYIVLDYYHKQEWKQVTNANFILISKQEMRLRLIDYKGREVFSAPVAIGKNPGDKQTKGDMKTPEGVFQVSDIQNSAHWKHDFKDGKGEIEHAYGNYFIRLLVPGQKGIGIHGTHLPESIGTRASEGCIRMENDDLDKLVSLIYPPLVVVITPGLEDVQTNLKQ